MNKEFTKIRSRICTNPNCNRTCSKIHLKTQTRQKENNKPKNPLHKNKMNFRQKNVNFNPSNENHYKQTNKKEINFNPSNENYYRQSNKNIRKNEEKIFTENINTIDSITSIRPEKVISFTPVEKQKSKKDNGFYLNINDNIILKSTNNKIIFDNIHLIGGFNDIYNTETGVAKIPISGKYFISYNVTFLWEKNNMPQNITTYIQVTRENLGAEYLLTNIQTYFNGNITSYNNSGIIDLQKNDEISLYLQIPYVDNSKQIIKNFNESTFFSCIMK